MENNFKKIVDMIFDTCYNTTMKKMIRKFMINWRSFKIKYIRNERCKEELSGPRLWDIYQQEMIKMKISMNKRLTNK